MAKTNTSSTAQGAVEFKIAKAIEKANSLLITNEDNQSYLISKDILFDNGIVNPKQLKGKTLSLEPKDKTYGGFTFASVVDDDLAINTAFESLQLQQMAKLKATSRFHQILNRGNQQVVTTQEEEQ
jgi:hypothetical protein